MRFAYTCPHCDADMQGDFGDDAECENCQIAFETEWDYFGDDYNMASWLTGVETPLEGK